MNDDFENQIRSALQRKEPAAGFEQRVLNRIRAKGTALDPGEGRLRPPQRSRISWLALHWVLFPRPAMRLWVVAALVLAFLAGAEWAHVRRQQMEAQLRQQTEARRELEVALRITSRKLQHIQGLLQAQSGRVLIQARHEAARDKRSRI
jgi:hypothetical protein